MSMRHLPVLFLVLSLLACKSEPPAEQTLIRPIRFQRVQPAENLLTRTFSGTAQAGLESRLSFRIPGAVEEVAVKVGDRVRAGQVISRLDDTDYVLQAQEAQAALANARAQARNAEANYERVRALYENSNASLNDLDAARAASESANASVRASSTRLELARSQLRYTRLSAPADGAIASVPIEVNENIAAGQMVALLTSADSTEVDCTIPESFITKISRDMPVSITFDALSGREFVGRVTEVGVAATRQATTYPVTVRLEDNSPQIRPGMAAAITFRLPNGSGDQAMLVAPEAVGEDRQGRFAFVVKPGENGIGIISRRSVTVGELKSRGLEVLSGLQAGELVVTAGISRVKEGQQVRILASNEVAP
ncbi:MAG: efflux RND transporter periplasmic adaptor subunit [Syntrophotaleaceae bacterium]